MESVPIVDEEYDEAFEESAIEALPNELLYMIVENFSDKDLNSLSKTCTRLYDVVLPILFDSLTIRVPMRWSRLTSLEDLVGFRSPGLQYTTAVRIVTQHGPVKYSQCGLVHRDPDEIDVSYT